MNRASYRHLKAGFSRLGAAALALVGLGAVQTAAAIDCNTIYASVGTNTGQAATGSSLATLSQSGVLTGLAPLPFKPGSTTVRSLTAGFGVDPVSNRILYIDGNGGAGYTIGGTAALARIYSYNGSFTEQTSETTGIPAFSDATTEHQAGVDEAGTLWATHWNGNKQLYKWAGAGNTTGPFTIAAPTVPADATEWSYLTDGDMAFDGVFDGVGQGRLWFVSSNSAGNVVVYMVVNKSGGAYQAMKVATTVGTTLNPAVSPSQPTGGTNYVTGDAFGTDGKLYISTSGGDVYTYDTVSNTFANVTTNAGTITTATTASTTNAGAITDLGSCVYPRPDLSVTKAHTGSFVQSSTGSYTITITNNGKFPTTSLPILFKDALPTGMTFASASSSSGTVTGPAAGTGGTIDLSFTPTAVLAPNASVSLTLTVNVSATAAAGTNYVSVGGGGDKVNAAPTPGATCTPTSHCASDATTVVSPPPKLTLIKTVVGRANLTDQFTVQIKNGATVTASASTSGVFTSASTGAVGLVSGTTYTLMEVGAGTPAATLGNYTTTYTCTNTTTGSTTALPLPGTAGQSFTLTPKYGDVITCTMTNMPTPVLTDLSISKTGPLTLPRTDTATYTIKVWNQGPAPTTGATITDTVPSNLTNVTWTCTASGLALCGTANGSGNTISFVSGLLPVNVSTGAAGVSNAAPTSGDYLTITVTGTASTDGTFTNTASVAAPAGVTDSYSTNNGSSQTTTVALPFTSTNPAVCSTIVGNTGVGSNLVTDFSNGTFGTSTGDPLVGTSIVKSPTAWAYTAANIPNYTYIQEAGNAPNDGYLSLVNRLADPRVFGVWSNTLTPITVSGSGVAGNDLATGRYLLINGANKGKSVIETTITGLTANTNYQVLGLFSNVIDSGVNQILPNLNFEINGASYFKTGDIPQDNNGGAVTATNQAKWRQAGFVFNSGNSTSITFKMVSNVDAGNGNDFAFDQLALNKCQGTYVNTLSGFLYGDVNTNSSYQSATEPQLPAGVVVDLQYTDPNGNPVTVARTTIGLVSGAGNTGKYVFTNVPPPPTGFSYFVHVEDGSVTGEATTVPAGYTLLTPNNVAIPTGTGAPNYVSGTATGPDFGFNFADLSVTKTDGVTSIGSGASTSYTIRVANAGSIGVTGAVLTDPAVTGLNATATACSAAAGNKCVTAPTLAAVQGTGLVLPTLASGAFYEITLTGTVTAAGGATVANVASVTAPSGITDVNTSNDSATDSDTVTAQPPVISLLKLGRNVTRNTAFIAGTGSVGVDPKDVVEYCLVYSNTGGAAPNFKVTDNVPAGVDARLGAYTAPGKGIRWANGVTIALGAAAAPAGVDLFSAANDPLVPANDDQGTLTTTGGTNAKGVMTFDLGAAGLAAGGKGTVCFQTKVP